MKSCKYTWAFPLERTHTGIVLGNGTLGAMVWGEGRQLRITLGRADLWDHRGGMPWKTGMSYVRIRKLLEKGNEAGLRKLFEGTPSPPGHPERPSVIPVGRIDLLLPKKACLDSGLLELADGSLVVTVRCAGRTAKIRIAIAMQGNGMAVSLPAALAGTSVKPVPAWEFLADALREISFEPPASLRMRGVAGWVQTMPADPALAVAAKREGNKVWIAVERGDGAPAARGAVAETLRLLQADGEAKLQRKNGRWWARFWRRAATVGIPNERLSFLYHYGMYRFASFTRPGAVPATLQGAWIEEYRLPPWSSDYHFNINVQMCYQPAYHGNCLEHLMPLFEMLFSWTDALRANAKVFLGIDDGIMLPHAVDDRCVCMGGFWTGSVDHACTAWMALMMHRYYRYSMDREFLKRAYPFMIGAMRVYEEMIEKDGKRLCLPLGVSPEYRGAEMDAWGKNASFQLACVHALTEACIDSARVLRKKPVLLWRQIVDKLPKATLVDVGGTRFRKPVIGLWEGLAIEESHRHHAHLSGITPFDTIDPDSDEWREIVERSLGHWVYHGTGLWSGWCLTWASCLHSHVNNGEAAEFMLEAFDRFFSNEGGGPVHDAWAAGFSLMGQGGRQRDRKKLADVMQMDGAMGSVGAIHEMMLHTRRGVNHVFAGVPWRWRDCSFKGMRTDGAFLISAERKQGCVACIRVESEQAGIFKVRNPWEGSASVKHGRLQKTLKGRILKIHMKPGEKAEIRKAKSH